MSGDRWNTPTPEVLSTECSRQVGRLLPPLLAMQRSSWEQGVAAQALLECYRYDVTIVPHALAYIYGLVHDSMVRQGPDGRLAVLLNGNGSSDAGAIDPACIGECLYYLMAPPPYHPNVLSSPTLARVSDSVERMLDYLLDANGCPRSPISVAEVQCNDYLLSHRADAKQIWSDSVHMLSPFLASAAVYYAEHPHQKYDATKLLRMSLQQIIFAAHYLQSATGEWSHIYDLEKNMFIRRVYWGVGNGWVCCGIIRVLRTMVYAISSDGPEGAISQMLSGELGEMLQQCHTILTRTLNACLRHRRADGLFFDVLGDKSSFVETNLSQQLAYTIYRLLDLHLYVPRTVREQLSLPTIDSGTIAEWEDTALVMRAAAEKKVDEWGLVRDVCGSPRFDSPGTAAEGQAWGILLRVAYSVHQSLKQSAVDHFIL